MGEVYRARDTRLDRNVPINVCPDDVATDADRLRRFEREARALAALNRPNLVSIHIVRSHEGAAHAAMERLEVETLRQSLVRPMASVARKDGTSGARHSKLALESLVRTTERRTRIRRPS